MSTRKLQFVPSPPRIWSNNDIINEVDSQVVANFKTDSALEKDTGSNFARFRDVFQQAYVEGKLSSVLPAVEELDELQ